MLLSFDNLTEDDVLRVQPGSHDGGDEELRSIGIGTGVGHGKKKRFAVLEVKVLICELLAVNGSSTRSVSTGEIASLEHELRDHTVED